MGRGGGKWVWVLQSKNRREKEVEAGRVHQLTGSDVIPNVLLVLLVSQRRSPCWKGLSGTVFPLRRVQKIQLWLSRAFLPPAPYAQGGHSTAPIVYINLFSLPVLPLLVFSPTISSPYFPWSLIVPGTGLKSIVREGMPWAAKEAAASVPSCCSWQSSSFLPCRATADLSPPPLLSSCLLSFFFFSRFSYFGFLAQQLILWPLSSRLSSDHLKLENLILWPYDIRMPVLLTAEFQAHEFRLWYLQFRYCWQTQD